MGFYDDLRKEVRQTFTSRWTARDGQTVPSSEDVKLGNDAVKLDAVVLYTDLSGSTALVDKKKAWFAAEIYKSFLYCAAKVIRRNDGVLTSYDGDRVMGVFIGDAKNTSAAKAALGINHVAKKIINDELAAAYPKSSYRVSHVTAVDSSHLYVARTGIRGSNDLVWVGRSANHAAKLSSSTLGAPSLITADVFGMLHKSAKFSSDGKSMWVKTYWPEMARTVYSSTWTWNV